MNDLVRASSLFGGAHAPTAGPSGMLGTVPNPPPEVVHLPVGTTLHGVVEGHDGKGQLLVRTELGTLAVATKAQLPADSAVTLQIRSSGAQLHVLLMHSEAPPASAQGTPAPNPQQSSAPHGGGAGPQAQPGGAPVTGQAAAAGQGAGHPAGQGAGHPAGHLVGLGAIPDELTLGQTVRAVVQAPAAAPNRAPGPNPGPAITSGTSTGAGASVASGGSSLSALAAQLMAGSELQLRIVTVQAPIQAPAAQAPAAQATATNTATIAAGIQVVGTPVAGTAPRTQPPGSSSHQVPPPTSPPGSAPASAPGTPATPAGPATQTVGQPALPATQAPAGLAPTTGAPVALAGQSVATAPAAPGGNAPAAAAIPAGARTTAVPAPSPAAPSPTAPVGTAPASPAPARTTPAPTLLASYASPGAGHAAAPQATPGTTPGAAPQGAPGARGAVQPAAPPGTGVPAEGTTAPGALRFTGTVTAITHAGQPVLQTPLGTLTLEIQAPLPIGSRLTLEMPAEALPQPAPAGVFRAPEALGTLAHAWPALEEALQALPEIAAPGVARAALDMVPQPGPRLASGLLFFLAALSAGEVGRWLGNPATQALKKAGREPLLSRLGQDFGQLSRLAETPGGDWRLFFIPLLDGEQLQQFRLFLRHGEHGNGGGEDDEPTRFIVELELSRLGDLQLDGLVRHKRLDLILRTRAPLPEVMRHDIARIFHDANDATGFGGSIGFQSSAKWQFMPIEAPATASPGVMV